MQEVAALTVVDTHVRERVCGIRQQEEEIATVLSQVSRHVMVLQLRAIFGGLLGFRTSRRKPKKYLITLHLISIDIKHLNFYQNLN